MIAEGKFKAKNGKIYNEVEVMFTPAKNYNVISPSQEVEYTSKLFAASKDLVIALKEAHRFLRKNGYDMTQIDAALKKAGV